MRVENNNVSGQNLDPEQIDLIDLLVQLWRGKMTIIISVIVAIALAIGYLVVAKEKWTSTAIVTQPDVGQIAGYNNAINVIYGSAAPKVSEIQSILIGRFSTTFSALAETLDNQEEPEKLTIEPSVKNQQLPLTVSYLFNGFEDNTQYQIECNGVTSQGTQITTGLTTFNVAYIQPSIYSYFFLTNNCDEGYITFQSNVVGVPGTSNPDPPVFINNQEVDLTTNGSYVQWNEGYEVEGNWTASIWGRNFSANQVISNFTNTNDDNIFISYRDDGTNAWAELRVVPNGWDFGYTIYSSSISLPEDTEQVFIWTRNINNIYDIQIQNLGVVT